MLLVVQSLSCAWVFETLVDCSTLGFPVLHYFLEFAQIHVHWVNDAIQPSHPLSSPFPPAFSVSQHQGLFQWVGCLHQVVSPSNEYSGLISFMIEWFDLLAVQGTFKSLLQHHSSRFQFFSTQSSLWSNSHICTWQLEKPPLWLDCLCQQSDVCAF